MIRIVLADEMENNSELLLSMYKDRAKQFYYRLAWDVQVDELGRERDEFDEYNPIYIIAESKTGAHQGSLRIMPTTGETMICKYFCDLISGFRIKSSSIWECTRLCLSPRACKTTTPDLLFVAMELGLKLKIKYYVAVFELSMKRVYQRHGWEPQVVGQDTIYNQKVCVGLWPVSLQERERLLEARANNVLPSYQFASNFWKSLLPAGSPQQHAGSAHKSTEIG